MAKKQASQPERPRSTSDRIEAQLVRAALEAVRRGETPSGDQRRALKRWEKRREEEQRLELLRSCPKRLYAELSGRQQKVLNDQAARYGVPIGVGKAEIDIGAVLRWMHDFLAENAQKLRLLDERSGDDALLMSGSDSPALEEYRRWAAREKELRVREMEGDLRRVDEVREGLAIIAGNIRGAGQQLAREFGDEAARVLNEALDEAADAIDARFGDAAPAEQETP